MRVSIDRDGSDQELTFSGPVLELLNHLGINPETVVVVRNGEVVAEDVKVSGDDQIRIISVVSGG